MSVLGGKAAGMAAVSGAGSSLRDRFPTLEKQQERIAQLDAQREYFIRHKMREALTDVEADLAKIKALSPTPKRIGATSL